MWISTLSKFLVVVLVLTFMSFTLVPSAVATAPGTVLLDQEGVRITYTGMTTDTFGNVDLNVTIENNTNNTVFVSAANMSVNGIMLSGLFGQTLTAGHRANTSIWLSDGRLAENGITAINEVRFNVVVADGTTFVHIFSSDTITINPDGQAAPTPTPVPTPTPTPTPETGGRGKSDFGVVPQTGIPDITWLIVIMGISSLLTVLLGMFLYSHVRKKQEGKN